MVDLVQQTNHLLATGKPWIAHYGLWMVAAGGLSQALPLIGVLMPGLAINMAAGFLCAAGVLGLPQTLLASWGSMYAGLAAVYFLGRWLGSGRRGVMRQRLAKALEEDRWMLYYYFFAEPLRLAIPYMAGSLDYPPRRWLLINIPGSLVYVAFQLTMGIVFHLALGSTRPYVYFSLLAVAVGLSIFATAKLAHRLLHESKVKPEAK